MIQREEFTRGSQKVWKLFSMSGLSVRKGYVATANYNGTMKVLTKNERAANGDK